MSQMRPTLTACLAALDKGRMHSTRRQQHDNQRLIFVPTSFLPVFLHSTPAAPAAALPPLPPRPSPARTGMWSRRLLPLRRPCSTASSLSSSSSSSSLSSSTSLSSSPCCSFSVFPSSQRRSQSSASGAGFYNFPPSAHYDLIVIGSGPAAQKCAIDSVKRGNRVAMIDKNSQIGGACVHTGTIPSKTFREAVLHLTGYRHQGFYGKSAFMSSRRASMNEILQRVQKVEDMEAEVVRHQMRRNGVHLVTGTARFVEHGPNEKHIKLAVLLTDPEQERKGIYKHRDASLPKTLLTAEKVMVACGTRPVRQEGTIFDGKRVFDSDQLLWGGIDRVPRSFIVVGAGVIGIEYASMINVLPGTNVTIIDPRSQLLGFADREVVDALQYSMRHYGARFIMGENVEKIETLPDRAVVHLASGKRIAAEGVLYAMGRQGNTDTLNIDAAGITSDKRGLLEVNSVYQTTNPNIYAAGDCIGYPALASTSMEQGRRASCHMWGDYESIPEHSTAEDHGEAVKSVLQQGGFLGRDTEQLFPYGIYTIPEISMIGKTEEQLTAEKIPYEVGLANYKELAKGQMLGGMDGFLKLIFSTEDFRILGVHAFGDGATEIVHIGQVVMAAGGSVNYFVDAVFNYPTLAEAYNVAAHNGLRNMGINV